MPIELPPIIGSDPAADRVGPPEPTAIHHEPVPRKLAGLVVRAGQQPVVAWTLRDDEGRPLDLAGTPSGAGVTFALRFREAAGGSTIEFPAAVTDPAGGTVEAAVDLARLAGPGIYLAEIAATTPGVRAANQFYLVVEPSLFADGRCRGPLTLPEIRLHLRDSGPAENRLLGTLQFDNAEIAACMVRAVDYWNDTLPPIGTYTTQTFPFRYLWLEGTIAGLYELAAEWYRKNHLQYQGGGVAVDDMNKAREYEEKAAAKWQQFQSLVRQQKISINAEEGWGSVPSAYGRGRW
jgi:hypothetical protein